MFRGTAMAGLAIQHVTVQPQLTAELTSRAESLFRCSSRQKQHFAPRLLLPFAERLPNRHSLGWVRPFDGADFEVPAVDIPRAAKMGVEG